MSIDLNKLYSGSSVDPGTVTPQLRTSATIARELINRSMKKASSVSFFYKEMLRAVIAKFSDCITINPDGKVVPVSCIHATQERAIAKLVQETNLILPIISIDQPKSSRDEKRGRYKPVVLSEKITDTVTKRNHRVVSLAPTPIEVEYEVIVLCKYKSDLDQISEQIHSWFLPDLELTTSFSNNIKLFIKEEATESEIIAADREDRVIKRVFRVFASTYIPSPKFLMTSTGQIEDFNFEYEIDSDMSN